MPKRNYRTGKLIDTKGHAHPCNVGLVDEHGAFFLLLDEDTPSRYLRFSDESEALTNLLAKCERLEDELYTLREVKKDLGTNGGYVRLALAATLLGCTQVDVSALIRAGKLAIKRQDGLLWVSLVSIGQYLEGGHNDAA